MNGSNNVIFTIEKNSKQSIQRSKQNSELEVEKSSDILGTMILDELKEARSYDSAVSSVPNFNSLKGKDMVPILHKTAWTNDTNDDIEEEENNTSTLKYIILAITKVFQKMYRKLETSFTLQGVYGILIPVLVVAISNIITIWPQNNVILYPAYWYEFLVPTIFGFIVISTANTLIEGSIVLENDKLWSKYTFLILFVINTSGFVAAYVSVYGIWVAALRYRHPMPFVGTFCAQIAYVLKVIIFWFLSPPDLRIRNKQYRNRLKSYVCLFPIAMIMSLEYTQLSSLFFRVPLKCEKS